METGDYIALDEREISDDPAVVYLAHDDESRQIATSFTTFLREWERLYYVGPESWMIEPFHDEDGFLNSETERAESLRHSFDSRK